MPATPDVDLEALTDLRTPWCLHAVATLRIANHLTGGPATVGALAAAAGCDADALHSVLGHLVSRGVFEQPSPGRFALNEPARALLDPGLREWLDLDGIGGRFAHAWGTLPTWLRTGRAAYAERFGRSFWDDLAAHPELGAQFDAMMGPAGHGTPDPELALEGGWADVGTVVDVGGGTGAMLAEVLRTHPRTQGVLVDLPATVARSPEVLVGAGVAGRVTLAGQSFFEPLPRGDLYLVRKVLNDWPDAEAEAILRRCAGAAGPTGRVIVIGSVAPEAPARRIEIETLLVGGRQRSLAEFTALAGRAGLEVVALTQQPSGRFVVECRAGAANGSKKGAGGP